MPTRAQTKSSQAVSLDLPGMRVRGDPADELRHALGPGALVAGIDEVGRGPLAGPVVAAAVVLDPLCGLKGLDDSKELLPEEREELYPRILEASAAVGLGVVEAEVIDRINILQATFLAMRKAFEACEADLGAPVRGAVVDGHMRAPLEERVAQQAVIQGDGRSTPIMAASIVAKVVRDRRMLEEAERYPAYGFESHKGYSTPCHRRALDENGPCRLHRYSFAPIRLRAEQRFHPLLPPGWRRPAEHPDLFAEAWAGQPAEEQAVLGEPEQ